MRQEKTKWIAVIEDDHQLRMELKQRLSKIKSIKVQVFSSAEECLNEIGQQPALILVDYSLNENNNNNGMSGHEALNCFRQNNAMQKVMFISTKEDRDLLEEYKAYRSVDYIEKSNIASNRMIKKVKQQLFAA